ncbi:MAG: hypothetical protein IKO74_00235 [Selenomonadaceae bacterium]|nr:hypothetical protein [Selenomonadaceae bacterium]
MAKTFTYTGGNKTVSDYNGGDIIKISAAAVDGYSFSGNDLIFKIGKGTLTLKDMKGRAITVKNSSGKTTTKIYGTGYSAQDVIKNLVKAWSKSLLTETAKLDESIKMCTPFESIQDVIDKMISDCKKAGDADTFLKKYCGIILGNDDTGAITGWDAGGLKVKTTSNVIPDPSTVKTIKDYTKASFVANNVTINIAEKLSSLTAVGKKILNGLYSRWAEESLSLIEESYGVEFSEGNTINFSLVKGASYWGRTTDNSVKINVSDTKFNSADDYNGNGVDRAIAHEFTHIAQNLFMGNLPRFLAEGLAELTCGADHRRASYIKSLAGNATALKKYLDVTNYSTGDKNTYAAGYMFLRYLAKQTADSFNKKNSYAWTDKASIVGTSKADFLTGSGKNFSILGGAGNDSLSAQGDGMKIFGEAGNDLLLTNANAITASGGNGNDKIKNRGDNSSLSGAAGNDFIINGGYRDYELGGSSVSISGGKGNDTITSHGEKSRLDGGDGNDLIYNGYRYYEAWDYFYNRNDENFSGKKSSILGGKGNDSINNLGDFVTIDGGAGNNVISNGSDYCVGGNKVSIAGGAAAESLTNYGGSYVTIKAGAGNDTIKNIHTVNYADYNQTTKKYDTIETIYPSNVTLEGGKGNDYLENDGANVLFKYNSGDGNDSIQGFNDTSTLQIGGTYSTQTSGKDIIFTVGGGKVTLKNAKGKLLYDDGKNIFAVNRTFANKTATYTHKKKTLVTVSGVKSLDGLSLNKKIVTVSKASLGTDKVTVTDGYTLALGKNVTKSSTSKAWSLNKSTAALKQTTSAGYTLANNAVTYSKAATKTLATIAGVKSLDGISLKGKIVTLKAGSLNKKVTVSGSGYEFDFASDFNKASISGGTGDDSIKIFGSAMTVSGGKGNDSLWGSANADTFLYTSGDGNDIIYGFDDNDTLTFDALDFKASCKNDSIIFKVDGGSVTLKNFSATTFNVNGTAYKISGSKLKA